MYVYICTFTTYIHINFILYTIDTFHNPSLTAVVTKPVNLQLEVQRLKAIRRNLWSTYGNITRNVSWNHNRSNFLQKKHCMIQWPLTPVELRCKPPPLWTRPTAVLNKTKKQKNKKNILRRWMCCTARPFSKLSMHFKGFIYHNNKNKRCSDGWAEAHQC